MNQQNRLALVLTGLSTFLLGAGSYWLAFDRPGKPPPSRPSGSVVNGRKPQPEKTPPKTRSQPKKPKPKHDTVERRHANKKTKQIEIHRKGKGHGRVRIPRIKKTSPAG